MFFNIKKKLSIIVSAICMSIISSVNVYASNQKKVKVVFVGDYASGKSAVRSVLYGQKFDFITHKPSLKSDKVTKIVIHNGVALVCELWDTSGKSEIKDQIIDYRAKGAEFVVITVDLSREANKNFEDIFQENLIGWAQQIRTISPNTHIILLGTKSDLISSSEADYAKNELKGWADRYKGRMSSLVCSAINNDNVDGIINIIKRVLTPEKVQQLKEWEDISVANNEVDDTTKKKGGICIIV